MMNIVSAAKIELRTQEDKACNLLFFGLPLSDGTSEKDRAESDFFNAHEILELLKSPNVSDCEPQSVHRFKSKNGNASPPVLVKLKCAADRPLFLKKAKILKDSD